MIKKLPFYRNYTTNQWSRWWKNRKIDWNKEYAQTWNHPHRNIIVGLLNTFSWLSLIEIGCGAGANLIKIAKNLPGKQLGGVDINPEAIAEAERIFEGGVFKVCPADDVMMSDKSTDVSLTDMTLIYVSPLKITKHLKELKRITRNYIIICEFHSESWWQRLKLRLTTGYNAYNYKKRLQELGFYDIITYKIPDELWPGVKNDKFRFIIKAKVPRRY